MAVPAGPEGLRSADHFHTMPEQRSSYLISDYREILQERFHEDTHETWVRRQLRWVMDSHYHQEK